MADVIPGAKFVELFGPDHLPFLSDAEIILGEIEEFLTGVRGSLDPDRVLATVLFTDVVGATAKAVAMGDRRWHDLLDSHHFLVRRELARYRGREVDTVGDGFLFATRQSGGRAGGAGANLIPDSLTLLTLILILQPIEDIRIRKRGGIA